MDMRTDVRGVKEFKKKVDELAKDRIPTALASALNRTAYSTMEAEHEHMQSVFNPGVHPYLKRGIRYEKASTSTLVARVYAEEESPGKHAPAPKEILAPHLYGGARSVKVSERSLRFGYPGLFRADQFIRPGAGAKLDQYGNISAQEMVKIKSGARIAEATSGTKMNITPRSKKRNKSAYGNLFVIPYKGVFRRLGPSSIIPVLVFTRSPRYQKRFKFYETSRKAFDRHFVKNMNYAWNQALTSTVMRGV